MNRFLSCRSQPGSILFSREPTKHRNGEASRLGNFSRATAQLVAVLISLEVRVAAQDAKSGTRGAVVRRCGAADLVRGAP